MDDDRASRLLFIAKLVEANLLMIETVYLDQHPS